MTILPTSLARVPNALATQLMLNSITRSGLELLNAQAHLASGQRLNRPSDDAVATSAVSVLDDVLERRDQRLQNLSQAGSVLNTVDAALGDVMNQLLDAQGVANSQIGLGSDAGTRKSQARVIDAILGEVTNIAQRRFQQVQLFGGASSQGDPFESLLGGIRYRGEGEGLVTDLGQSRPFPITVSGEDAFGALSGRVQGDRDLDPIMLTGTRLSDLGGGRGLGVSLGTIDVTVNGSLLKVDLTTAHTVQDVIDTLNTAIQAQEPGASVSIDPATQNRFRVDPAGATIVFADPVADATAADLGLAGSFSGPPATGGDLDPQVTDHTPISSLTGVTVPLGTIRLTNLGQTRDVDLSAVTTVEGLRNVVEGAGIGVRVVIADSGDRINFLNELSGGSLSVAEVAGGTTATELGVRSLAASTLLADFNDGLGVQIRSGSVDPVTGLPDPAQDLDLRISTRDGGSFDVDFAGATTVQDVLDAVNAASGGTVSAGLVADGNGIELTDLTAGGGAFAAAALNGSFAGHDLGILGSTTGATLSGEDRATVAVDSVFSHLIALRDALEQNDERGIELAGGKLETDLTRTAETRAEVGVRSRRVTDATRTEEDLSIQDTSLRSQFRDLDFTEAALRFSLLQQQLQAGLATAGRLSSLSLLDFLR